MMLLYPLRPQPPLPLNHRVGPRPPRDTGALYDLVDGRGALYVGALYVLGVSPLPLIVFDLNSRAGAGDADMRLLLPATPIVDPVREPPVCGVVLV